MNIHLNIFRPYQRDAGHEDQLTRAALITMRLVPQAYVAFLDLARCPDLASLAMPRFNMQTGTLSAPDVDTDDPQHVEELVSVFLAPHEHVSEAIPDFQSQRAARYDGVVQHGSRLLVVIESKLFEAASDWQSLDINTSQITAETERRIHVRWNDLLERWWSLIEIGVLSATEQQILSEFADFAEEHFSWLLPFTTLERCGTDIGRRQRRLRSVLAEATDLSVSETGAGAVVMFPPDQVLSIQRAELVDDGGSLTLAAWPAELVGQAQHLYSQRSRVDALLALGERDGWELRPNFHISYFRAPPRARWYTSADEHPARDYLEHWVEDVDDSVGRYPRAEVEKDEFWEWLLDRGYALAADRPGLECLLAINVNAFDVRPGIEISHTWDWVDAVRLDGAGGLVAEVRDALTSILGALDERLPLPADDHGP